MNVLKHIILTVLSIVQTVCGVMAVVTVYGMVTGSGGDAGYATYDHTTVLIVCLVLMAVLAFLTCWIRGVRDMGLFLGLPEFLLSPIAAARILIGTIAFIASRGSRNIEFDYSETCMDGGLEPLDRFTKFMFGFYVRGRGEISKTRNIITHVCLCVPIAIADTACFWLMVQVIIAQAFPLYALFFAQCIVLFSALLCAIRGQSVSISYWHGRYTFENRYSGATKTYQASDRSLEYDIDDDARDFGWERTGSGYGDYFTGWAIATIVFSPIIGATQLCGTVMAILASPTTHILSSYAKLDYEDYRCAFLQRILHFFFSFVID